MAGEISIKRVSSLPTPKADSAIGKRIEDFVPSTSLQPKKVTEQPGGNGLVRMRHYWYDRDSDGFAETRVTFTVNRNGQDGAHPHTVDVEEGEKNTTLWATREDGVIDWQQVSEGRGRGSWFENILDQNRDGTADVLVQGYLGVSANRFEKTDAPTTPRTESASHAGPAVRTVSFPGLDAPSRIGQDISTLIPTSGLLSTKTYSAQEGASSFPQTHWKYDTRGNGQADCLVVKFIDRNNQVSSASVSFREAGAEVTYWADESGKINWEQRSKGREFRNFMDDDHNGTVDRDVRGQQGYVWPGSNTF